MWNDILGKTYVVLFVAALGLICITSKNVELEEPMMSLISCLYVALIIVAFMRLEIYSSLKNFLNQRFGSKKTDGNSQKSSEEKNGFVKYYYFTYAYEGIYGGAAMWFKDCFDVYDASVKIKNIHRFESIPVIMNFFEINKKVYDHYTIELKKTIARRKECN